MDAKDAMARPFVIHQAPDAGRTPAPNDSRRCGGVTGQCSLCLQTRQLNRLSHAVANWMFQFAKKEGAMIGVYESSKTSTLVQDGWKHYLLCDDCEEFASRTERYMRTLMLGTESERRTIGVTCSVSDGMLQLAGLDDTLIRQFLLVTLLRCHSAPSLPRVHFEEDVLDRVRAELLAREADTSEWQVNAMYFQSTLPGLDSRAIVIPRCIAPPAPAFSIFGAGWEWVVFARPHEDSIARKFRSYRLEKGRLSVVVGDIREHQCLQRSPGRYFPDPESLRRRQGKRGSKAGAGWLSRSGS